MFLGVEEGFDGAWEGVTSGLIDELVSIEGEIRGRRARQAEIIARLGELGIDEAEGDRGMEDWVARRLDVSGQTAHRLLTVSRHLWLWEQMTTGDWGLDRASHLAKLVQAGASPETVAEAAEEFSLGRLWGVVEQHRRVGAVAESASHESRFLVVQPSLDSQMVKVWGQLYGADGELVLKALNARADSFSPLADGESCSRGQLLADALTSICTDALTGNAEGLSGGRAVTVAEVFVDGSLAASSRGEAGVTVACGLRVGPETLAEILCDGKVRVIWTDHSQGSITASPLADTIPPAIRSLIWRRDQGQCSIEGCRSRHRLQIHHIRERHRGGDHDPSNLVLLCWFHHHVAIHMMGFRLDPQSPVHRRRLISPFAGRAPPPRLLSAA